MIRDLKWFDENNPFQFVQPPASVTNRTGFRFDDVMMCLKAAKTFSVALDFNGIVQI